MAYTLKIDKIEEVLKDYVGDKKVLTSDITRLTQPGENFGSTILKLDLILEDEEKQTQSLSLVAKLLPEQDFFRMVFNVNVSFKLEAAFYETVVPSLLKFQKQRGMETTTNIFAKFYGARMNLNGTENVDDNAVILLENLKESGKNTLLLLLTNY